MTTTNPAPRDIDGHEGSTFVRCPDCKAAVYNLRPHRQAHLAWHDDLDADLGAAQDAAEQAKAAASAAERALGEARREVAELRRELAEATGSTAPVAPLIAEWPADELAEHAAARAAALADDEPDDTAPPTGIVAAADAGLPYPDDDDPDAVEIPARRF